VPLGQGTQLTVEAAWVCHESKCILQVIVDIVTTTSDGRDDDDPTFLSTRISMAVKKPGSGLTHITLIFFYTADLDLRGDLLQCHANFRALGTVRGDDSDMGRLYEMA
jgi:hypothetical protein